MRRVVLLGSLLAALMLSACNEQVVKQAPPPPHALTASAIGNYCGMNVLEHPGPKAQIILASRIEPVWFSSARDALSFTMLPEEPKDILAIYVSDMAKATSWDKPGAENWIEARSAFFVVGSRMKSGMGADEAVPFSDRAAAETFAGENGGRVTTFAEVPPSYVLGAPADATGSVEEPASRTRDPVAQSGPKTGHIH